jgi:hypothetical protein
MLSHGRSAPRVSGFLGALIVAMNFGSVSAASAHSAGNSPSSNYVSTVTGIKPPTTTFSVKTIEASSRVELHWRRGPVIEIADYDGYPYLRVGPEGVEQNQESYAVYLNRDRMGATPIPQNLKPDGPPTWKRISSEPVARWHDHRVHWMGTVRPDGVRADPNRRQIIQPFTFDVRQGPKTFTVRGTLDWVPGPSPLPYLAGAALLVLGALVLALWAGFSDGRRDLARRVAAVAGVALAVVDAWHLVGIAFGIRGAIGSALGRMVSVGFVSMVGWVLLVLGGSLLVRRRLDAYYLIILGAGLVTIVGGFADLGVLSRSNSPFAFSLWTLRTSIAATLGLGLGLVVLGVMVTRRGRSGPEDIPVPAEPVASATP